ncbi:tRNA (adenosine(37)-N6)-threonylcarbamoyltransferase complex ATPase subunit type 1 TsaE [Candidatus Gracilibacteria bacterium]|nr:tRNA (adenosine(37)-N6)-threonylcarbamoyltransferase complex ATPase subunit type 1 TsaE [Candidatus Gracilibacteria bacterium]
MKIKLNGLNKLKLKIKNGDIIFLYGDLGAGKTTFISYFISEILGINEKVKSPTYIHYKKYLDHIYHFDLYKLENYDEFVNIGGEEIFDDKNNISFIEWPELIENVYSPTYKIYITKTETEDEREVGIVKI